MNRIPRFFRKPNPTKVNDDADILGFALHANGRVDAIKQGSGMYGAGFGEGAFSETAFGTQIALSQSTFGWSAAYSVSTWVYRCIEVRKSAIHRMPHGVYHKRTKEYWESHPLEIAFNRNKQKLLKKIEQSQLLYGETFIELPQNEYGFKSDLFWLNNNGMAVLIGVGKIAGYSYTAMQGGQGQNFEPDEIAFMKTDNPFNDLRGMSPTEVIMDEVAIDKDVARVVRAYYANDTRVGLLLIPKRDMQPADSARFIEEWKKQNQGVNRAGKPILMPQDMSVERVQEPASLDDVDLRESTRREIAAAYGVPLSLAGGWDDAKYQSLPEQRKSFYEETIIPECDTIAEFINENILPYFDDTGEAEFRFDYISILALTEDAQKKNDIYSNRLVSGVVTRAEARAALGHPVRPTDHVYYIPAGVTVVPEDEEALVTPTANVVDDTAQEQQAIPDTATPVQPPKPADKPAQLAPPTERKQLPAPPQPKSIAPPQTTVDEELSAWEKKALNNGALKAISFTAYVLPRDVQDAVRAALKTAGKDANKAAIRALFGAVKRGLAPVVSPVAFDYWKDFDGLMETLGGDWLNDYMARTFAALHVHAGLSAADVQTALDAHHDAFSAAWLGTPDAPGPLVKLIQAGMGAAHAALTHGLAANPLRPAKADLMAIEARDFAKQYAYDLIRAVDDTTRQQVSEAVAKWIESGEPLDSLKDSLTTIFHDPARAQMIAQTEATRAYAAGTQERYRRADVKSVKWRTVRDGEVCPVCSALAGTVALLEGGFNMKGSVGFPPAHPGCRCWLSPVVED